MTILTLLSRNKRANMLRRSFASALIGCSLILVLLSTSSAARAKIEKVLYSFTGGSDGGHPNGALIEGPTGVRYGTTTYGGNFNCPLGCGTIFQLDGSNVTVLYSFTGGADGAQPIDGLLLDSGGNLYGTTYTGGADNFGTVFKLTPDGVHTVLYSFTGGSDGANPNGDLVTDAQGNLYGTTIGGGTGACTGSCGVVFRLTPAGHETVLHAFTGSAADGGNPYAGVVRDRQGNLYGTTTAGGSSGNGTIYQVSRRGGEVVLHHFAGSPADGARPYDRLLLDAVDNLYGTTLTGGADTRCSGGCGTVFEIAQDGTYNLLHSFIDNLKDGTNPTAGLDADAAGNLYGTTVSGGAYGEGTLFKVTPDGDESIVYSFAGTPDGQTAQNRVMVKANGSIFGTTSMGGANNQGTIFEIRN